MFRMTDADAQPGNYKPGGVGSVIDAFLDSPLSGIAPWVVFSLFSTPGRFEAAVGAALGLTLLMLWVGSRRGISIHSLEVFGVAFFAILAVVGLTVSAGTIRWLELWAGELTNVALALFACATLIARRPFTVAYAKERAPQEYWDSALFLHINYAISAVWAAAFTVSAIVGFIGDLALHDSNNFWTGWVLQIATLFFAVAFTEFYPAYAGAKDAADRGEPEEVAPPISALFDWVPTFILAAGIFGWVTNALPDAVGIGMVVFGAGGAVLIRTFSPKPAEPLK
jgi:hypothetical protein